MDDIKKARTRRSVQERNEDSLTLVMYKLEEIGEDVKVLSNDVKILNEDLLKRKVTSRIFWATAGTLAAITAWAGELLDNILAVWRP